MTSTSSTPNKIIDYINELVGIHTVNISDMEERKRYRDEKKSLFRANEQRKAQLLEMKIQKIDKQFFLDPHDHLIGGFRE